ncbi:MAG: tetratricopeptide repeat protein [Acidobacteria bacterium]|nr:tetratricopeptide repeat protein [Acidobacteriota bacterium]
MRSFFESAGVLTDLKTYYRPVAIVSFMLDAQIGGTSPAIYHLTNVVLHAVVTVFLFRTLTRMGGAPIGALVASLIFAVHPANVQTVCWIMGRNELLLAAFSLIAFGSFIQNLRGRRRSWLVVHALAFAGAVFSKESGVVLLPLIVLYPVLWQSEDGLANRTRFSPVILLAVVDVGVVAIWWWLRRAALAGGPVAEPTSWQTLAANAPQVFSYLEKIVFPFRLNPMPGADRTSIVVGGIAAALLVVSLVRSLGIRRFGFVACWCLAFLLPALLVPGLPAYEHRLYVPMLGLALGFGLRATGQKPIGAQARSLKPEAQSLIAALAVAAVFSVVSFRYSETFRTPLAYWGRATEGTPYAPIAHVNVGQILQDLDKSEEARAHFQRALELDPRVPKAHNNLGVALMRLGRTREALDAFNTELALHPWNADAHYNVGLYYASEGNERDAIIQWEETLHSNKYYLPAYEKLAALYAARGDRAKADMYVQRARELQRR